MFIYLLRNSFNGKCYVGQTTKTDAGLRFAEHLYESKNRCRWVISKAIQKYGWDNFTRHVLEVCSSVTEMDEAEAYWISRLDSIAPNGYNVREGGNISHHNEETKAKLSAALKGIKRSAETRLKMSKSRSGENSVHSKLTWEQVREIRTRRLNGENLKALANEFGVSEVSISEIVRNKTWIE